MRPSGSGSWQTIGNGFFFLLHRFEQQHQQQLKNVNDWWRADYRLGFGSQLQQVPKKQPLARGEKTSPQGSKKRLDPTTNVQASG